MRILNVVQVPRGRAAALLPDIVAMQREIRSKDFTFLLTVDPEQSPYLDKLTERMETFEEVRDELRRHDIRAGVLVQTTLGHTERFLPRSSAPFQRMVGRTGEVCASVFCPLDKGFQDHIGAAMRMITDSHPAFILVDDDFRLHHPHVEQGCFCPLHLDLHDELHGVRISRDELLAAAAADTEHGRQTRARWSDTERESLLRLSRVIRDAIDASDPMVPAGICVADFSRLVNDDVARALAGPHRPLVRINGAVYSENGAKRFPDLVDTILRQRGHLGNDVEVLAESDTYPQHPYSVSGKMLSALLVTSTVIGLDGAKAWITPMDWHGGENPQFVEAYSRLVPIARALEPVVREVSWRGATMPVCDDEPHRLPWDATGGKTFLRPIWAHILGRMAFPQIPGGAAGRLRAFNGAAVTGYSSAQWETFLADGVLLDGEAARHLTTMGLGDHLGVHASIDPELYVNGEIYRNLADWNHQFSGIRHSAMRDTAASAVRLTPTSEHTTILGDYFTEPWREAAERTLESPSVTVFENDLGGRVAVYAAVLDAVPLLQHLVNPSRRRQLSSVLTWLRSEEFPLQVDYDSDLYLLVGDIDDHTHLVFALNLQPDPVGTLSLTAPHGAIRSVDSLDAEGHWTHLDAAGTEPGSAAVRVDLGYLDFSIMRVATSPR